MENLPDEITTDEITTGTPAAAGLAPVGTGKPTGHMVSVGGPGLNRRMRRALRYGGTVAAPHCRIGGQSLWTPREKREK